VSKNCLLMVAGERSGAIYGAELAAALKVRLGSAEIFGCGGEAMRHAGVETEVDAHQVSIVGITEVVAGLPRAYRAFQRLLRAIDQRHPRLAVLIDFPSFNLRLAKRLKQRKITVVYFVSPQIWAWKGWRIKEIKANVDKMLCIFDFEEAMYRQAGVPVEYVGHPLVDLVRPHLSREEFFAKFHLEPETTTIVLLPGSRETEVEFNLPPMLDAASRLALTRRIQFILAAAPTLSPAWLESMVAQCYVGRASVRTLTQATYDALRHSDLGVVASGTATVEAAMRQLPMIVVYRVSPVSWFFGKFMVKVPFYSMVNLLAGKPIVPELIQKDFTGPNLASRVEYLLDHAEAREEMVKGLRELIPRFGAAGAIQRAAAAVVRLLERPQASLETA